MSEQKQRGYMRFPPWVFRLFLNFYRPYRGAGIRMSYLAPDFRSAEMELRTRWFNRNPFGTHFGGGLYAMCDPIYVLLLARILGPGYVVWDKAATIRFLKPGRGTVTARFETPSEMTEAYLRQADAGETLTPELTVQVMDKEGDVVAEVVKTLYIRKKGNRKKPATD